MTDLLWGLILLAPYWLGPILVWLARRFYAFCPDVVDQGTETVAALARELRQARTLYCWRD